MLKLLQSTLVVAMLACGALAFATSAQEKTPPTPTPAPRPAPAEAQVYKVGSTVDEALKLTDLDGKAVSFKELRGKVVLVHFWSMNCPYEEVADPKVVALEKAWKDNKDVVILAINANVTEIGAARPAAGYPDLKKHAEKRGFTHRIAADYGNKAADLFQAKSTPHCFVLDRKGVIVYAGGLDDDPKGSKGAETKQYARDAVEATVANKAVEIKESKSYGCSIKRVTPER
ncbi:MAG: redoxin domain-containing protein [Planctomycetota bacterium]|nr:MAG: redoxin domain-containing protein [Planctomycetota bacterium]